MLLDDGPSGGLPGGPSPFVPRTRWQMAARQAISALLQLAVIIPGARWMLDGYRGLEGGDEIAIIAMLLTRLSIVSFALFAVTIAALPLMEPDEVRKLRLAGAPQWFQLRRVLVWLFAGAFVIMLAALVIGLIAAP